MASSTPRIDPHGSATLQRLLRDWDSLADDPRAADRVATWSARYAELQGTQSPHALAQLLHRLHRTEQWGAYDAAFAALIRIVRDGGAAGELAWRIAAYTVLPQMRKVAFGLKRDHLSYDDVYGALFSALFEAIGRYPLERRPTKFFTHLWMDAKKLARRNLEAEGGSREGWQRVELEDTDEPNDWGRADADADVQASQDPYIQATLADLLVRATALDLVRGDEPRFAYGNARTDLIELIVYAVDIGALTRAEALRVAEYYLRPDGEDTGPRTTRAMGAEGARVRQRVRRALIPLRSPALLAEYHAYLGAYDLAATA